MRQFLLPLIAIFIVSCESNSDKVKELDQQIEKLEQEKIILEKKALSEDVRSEEAMLGNFKLSADEAKLSEESKNKAEKIELEIKALREKKFLLKDN